MPQVVRVISSGTIRLIAMEERTHKNMLSPNLLDQLNAACDAIRNDADAKVAVIHGFDNYFCSGGTREELTAIMEGRMQFTDLGFHDLLMRFDIPVIAAMQGHALGAGLVLGCMADIMVLAEESVYSANFMKYGFTPGMGATYIIPQKMGHALGTEMLYTARGYRGAELKRRGLSAAVVKRAEVIGTATAIAGEIAEKPKVSLVALKAHYTRAMAPDLANAIESELEMHRQTFSLPEVKSKIDAHFGGV